MKTFVVEGVRHILEGADHVLCVVDALTLDHLKAINPRTCSMQERHPELIRGRTAANRG